MTQDKQDTDLLRSIVADERARENQDPLMRAKKVIESTIGTFWPSGAAMRIIDDLNAAGFMIVPMAEDATESGQ